MILGLTGGIATGKSTVSDMFQKCGAYVIDADQIARDVVEPGTQGLELVIKEFGEGIRCQDGRLNRVVLGNIIFEDRDKRSVLERILHPLIRARLLEETQSALITNEIIIWDIPLLIEKKMMHLVDRLLLVYASEEVQFNRLMERSGLTKEEALRRIRAQMNIEEKTLYANILIDNQGSLESTKRQVDRIWQEITKKRQK